MYLSVLDFPEWLHKLAHFASGWSNIPPSKMNSGFAHIYYISIKSHIKLLSASSISSVPFATVYQLLTRSPSNTDRRSAVIMSVQMPETVWLKWYFCSSAFFCYVTLQPCICIPCFYALSSPPFLPYSLALFCLPVKQLSYTINDAAWLSGFMHHLILLSS